MSDTPEEQKTRTYGEQAVGLSFNPSGDKHVHDVKLAFSQIIDLMDAQRAAEKGGETRRLYSIAITECQTAQMWCVKALTYQG